MFSQHRWTRLIILPIFICCPVSSQNFSNCVCEDLLLWQSKGLIFIHLGLVRCFFCCAEISINQLRQGDQCEIVSSYRRLCRTSEMTLKPRYYPEWSLSACFACVSAHHPAVKVSDLPHHFPKSQKIKLCVGHTCSVIYWEWCPQLAVLPPLFPVKVSDSLGTRRDRQLTAESRAWANSANTQQGGPRPHGGCLSVTAGINTPPTLKALQKRHGYSNSCDMQPEHRLRNEQGLFMV